MKTTLQTSCERVQVTLSVTLSVVLLAACAANLVLVCAWL
jgi:hypothetical protein